MPILKGADMGPATPIVYLNRLTIDGEALAISESILELAKEKLSLYRLIQLPQFLTGEILLRDRGIVSHGGQHVDIVDW